MGRRTWAIVITEAGDSSFVKELDPLDGTLQSKANIDFESWVMSVDLVPLRAPLKGFLMFLEPFFKVLDVISEGCFLLIMSIFPGSNRDA